MRVILAVAICAMALPAFAGGPTPEIALPDTPEQALESPARTGAAELAVPAPTPEIVDAETLKEHNNQVDEPNHPP